jgi:endonuclease-8
MPEGPALVILKEEVKPFKGKQVIAAGGYSGIDTSLILKQKINDFKTWGKIFLIIFPTCTVRIHFLLFGSYSINERKENTNPRLCLQFKKGELNFYMCSAKILQNDLNEIFDWSADVMNPEWDEQAALDKLMNSKDTLVCDALINQDIFSGVGNIIKNEVLYRVGVHPLSKIGSLKRYKLVQLIRETRTYSFDFLKWKKEGVLQENWKVHRKECCPKHDTPLKMKILGKAKRKAYYCEKCQVLYM